MEATFPATAQPVTVPTPTPATMEATGEFRRDTVIAYLVLSALVALSSLLPWMKIWFVEVSGLQWGIGWIVLLVSGSSATMAARSLSRGQVVRGLRSAQLGTAFVGVGAFALAYMAVNDACKEAFMMADSGSCAAVFLGNGAKLSLFAGAALGLTALFRKPEV